MVNIRNYDELIKNLEFKKLDSYERYKLGETTRLDFIDEKKKLDKEIEVLKRERSKTIFHQENIQEETLTRELMEKHVEKIIVRGSEIIKTEWK